MALQENHAVAHATAAYLLAEQRAELSVDDQRLLARAYVELKELVERRWALDGMLRAVANS